MKRYLYILFFAAVFTSCSQPEEAVNVQSLNQEFIGAWNSNDPEKVISYFADDVQFIQGETHFTGKTEVANKWVKDTYSTITDLKTNVVSSGVDEAMAYEAGTFSVDVLPTGQDQLRGIGEGNFILLWKKTDEGEWKLSYAQLEGLPVQVKN
ncbi:YybH family protein [Pontibacter anaerobius]|uniref:Nuclear transport factor 2 family protein n=1 Tax=Pontibacter anaerobius TaxID=2993940 RepID=A0ABT3RIP2_9BACT|nr:nuclear transport factor 2 family protein [Pontibacter anaerobius]MCX2741722.1 nuclear transport factor 2 family protein [Pontibacter anaerobius]